jgi:hypothetical protein
MVSSISSILVNQLDGKLSQMIVSDNPTTTAATTTSTTHSTQTFKVNMVQYSMPNNSQQPQGKKKIKQKNKNTSSKQNVQQTQHIDVGSNKPKIK